MNYNGNVFEHRERRGKIKFNIQNYSLLIASLESNPVFQMAITED